MAETTKIEWADSTLNPWRGCTKISPGCAHCYAETMSRRNPGVLGIWGDSGTRVVASENIWREAVRWNNEAVNAIYEMPLEDRQAGKHVPLRPRVFCASLADVFEDRPELIEPRQRLFDLIDSTPYLDWLLLTKRPQNIGRLTPENEGIEEIDGELIHCHVRGRDCEGSEGDCCWGSGWLPMHEFPVPSRQFRPNVWLGVSVENQEYADRRIPELLKIPAAVRFLSVEPLLGPIDLTAIGHGDQRGLDCLTGEFRYYREHDGEPCSGWGPSIDWVIVGGESGPNARPMHPGWARHLRDQCQAASVPFFFKQWGEWAPIGDDTPRGARLGFVNLDGHVSMAISGYEPGCPCDHSRREEPMTRVGKKAAGRMLDGRIWDELPRREAIPDA